MHVCRVTTSEEEEKRRRGEKMIFGWNILTTLNYRTGDFQTNEFPEWAHICRAMDRKELLLFRFWERIQIFARVQFSACFHLGLAEAQQSKRSGHWRHVKWGTEKFIAHEYKHTELNNAETAVRGRTAIFNRIDVRAREVDRIGQIPNPFANAE